MMRQENTIYAGKTCANFSILEVIPFFYTFNNSYCFKSGKDILSVEFALLKFLARLQCIKVDNTIFGLTHFS